MPPGIRVHALGDDRVGQRLEAGGHVALGLALRLEERRRSRRWRAPDRRRRPATPGRRCRRRARAGATTRVWKVESGPRIDSAAAATSSFCVDAPISGVSAPWVARRVVARAAPRSRCRRPAPRRRAPPGGAARRPRRPPARAPAAPTTAAWPRPGSRPARSHPNSRRVARSERDHDRDERGEQQGAGHRPRPSWDRSHQTAVSRPLQNSSRSTRLRSLPDSVRGSSSRTS